MIRIMLMYGMGPSVRESMAMCLSCLGLREQILWTVRWMKRELVRRLLRLRFGLGLAVVFGIEYLVLGRSFLGLLPAMKYLFIFHRHWVTLVSYFLSYCNNIYILNTNTLIQFLRNPYLYYVNHCLMKLQHFLDSFIFYSL